MKKIFLAVLLFIIGINSVYASSGFLRKDSVKTCDGTLYGQHSSDNHWHIAVKNDDGGYNAVGDPIYSDPCGQTEVEKPIVETPVIINPVVTKSNDNTLLKLLVNNDEIQISDNMKYSTNLSSVSLIATPKDIKAIIEYSKNLNLNIGDNETKIIVKSESGNLKTYLLNIKRENQLSSNVKLTIKVDDEVIKFDNFISKEEITVNNSVNEIKLTYEVEDSKTKVEVLNNKNLKDGKNEVILIVTAEDGTKQEYKIKVYKYSKAEDIIYGVAAVGILGGAGYGAVKVIKKRKKN